MPARPDLRELIIDLLQADGPLSYEQIAKQLGRAKVTVRQCIKSTNASKRTFRIAAWDRKMHKSGRPLPLWNAETWPDAPMPKPYTKHEIAARYRAKYRAKLNLAQRKKRGAEINVWTQLISGPTRGNSILEV